MNRLRSLYRSTSLVTRIVIGLAVGAVLGLTCPGVAAIGLAGSLFVGALKAIAPVLVAVLVASAIAQAQSGLGPRFRSVVVLYLLSTLLAAVVAVVGSFAFPVSIALSATAQDAAPDALADVFRSLALGMVSNPVEAVTRANYMGVLFWAIIIGLALKRHAAPATIAVVADLAKVVSQAVRWVIACAPLGIMGLVYTSVAESGLGIFTTYGRLLLLLIGCMAVSALVVNPALVAAFIGANPYPLVFRCLRQSGLSAFFTRSSAANIPINMALCDRLGVDRDFYAVSIPLGSTINMNGAAVTITVMTLAVCHTLGVGVGLPTALLLSLIATLAACGASGVAGGSLLLIPLSCSLFGIGGDVAMQAVAVGFVIGVVQDSVETALNSSGDVIFTVAAELHDRRRRAARA